MSLFSWLAKLYQQPTRPNIQAPAATSVDEKEAGRVTSERGAGAETDVLDYVADPEIRGLCSTLLTASSDKIAIDCICSLMARRAEVTKPLETVLCYGNDKAKRQAAIALGTVGNSGSVPILVDNLSDAEWTVRLQSARALGRIGDPSALGKLEQQLQNEDAFSAPVYKIGDRVVDNMHDRVKGALRSAIEALQRGQKLPPEEESYWASPVSK